MMKTKKNWAMGFKCFHVAGAACSPAVRVVGSDGRVRVYHEAVGAAEVMREHPRHLLCRSDALVIGQRVPALSPAERLEPGRSYFLLPAALFAHTALSLLSLASSLAEKRAPAFEVEKTECGKLRIRLLSSPLAAGDEEDEDSRRQRRRLCTTAALEKEYRRVVRCCERWKPKLEPIRELCELKRMKKIRSIILIKSLA